jgi:alcohol dehydrogenase, propanol-preferring
MRVGELPVSIFDVVLNREEALMFVAEGKVKATIETQPLESINDVFNRLRTGKVNAARSSDFRSKLLGEKQRS